MNTAVAEPVVRPELSDSDEDDRVHLYCHDPLVALCGVELDEWAEDAPDEDEECPACAVLVRLPCGECGIGWSA